MSTLVASLNTSIDIDAQNKEDFGKLVRRIMLSSSGQFASMASDGRPIKETAVPQTPSPIWARCKELAEGATNRCNYSQAEAMWLGALAEARTFDRRDPRLALTLESLASLYLMLERFEQAEMFNRNALESLIAIYGPMHIKVANCMNTLAGILYNQGRLKEAEPYCIKLLYIYEGAYGPDHADVGMAVNNLAMIYHTQGKHKQADRMYQRAIRIRTKALGDNHPIVVSLIDNYCNLLAVTGRSRDALELSRSRDISSIAPLPMLAAG
jgi:tetratricopeptide (TPR) repeat protein